MAINLIKLPPNKVIGSWEVFVPHLDVHGGGAIEQPQAKTLHPLGVEGFGNGFAPTRLFTKLQLAVRVRESCD